MSLLDSVECPEDLKALPKKDLSLLAREIRNEILGVVASNGGHLSSNLGVVELTIALHRVFTSPNDKIVWDVGHQCYAHKILTGRRKVFSSLRQKGGISGFPKRLESKHDAFATGHASTSVSVALGIREAMELTGKQASVVAVIGDGSLTGGMAFEALSHAGELKKPLIVILNDNHMSISKNVGSISQYLSRFTMHKRYQSFKAGLDSFVMNIPLLGRSLSKLIAKIKKGMKSVLYKKNIFVELGFEYVGPLDGHNIVVLEKVLKDVKKLKGPVVMHVHTIKGYGYSFARRDPQAFHGTPPFNLVDGKVEKKSSITFTQSFSECLLQKARENDKIVAITAAMATGTGLIGFKHLYPNRFFDVGIAEEHAVTFAAGLSTENIIPFVAIYSTFMQRCVDQVIHDVALENLHVIFALDRSGAVPQDGETHQGAFDISIFRVVPNLSIIAPASNDEMKLMIDWAIKERGAVIIRYAKKNCPEECKAFSSPIIKGKGVFPFSHKKSKILLVCVGSIYEELRAAGSYLREEGVYVDIYNLRFIKPLDEKYFLKIAKKYSHIFLFEDGAKIGGVSEYLETLILKESLKNAKKIKVFAVAFPDSFLQVGTRNEILDDVGLSANAIVSFVMQNKN